jgi:hypothetical protein
MSDERRRSAEQHAPAAQVYFMITLSQKDRLRQLGFDAAAIAAMTPQQAHRLLQLPAGAGEPVAKRLDRSCLVLSSIENFERDRCVDLFRRPDATFGFEEFRRDPEDRGQWTPVHCYSGVVFAAAEDALAAAGRAVPWLGEILGGDDAAL